MTAPEAPLRTIVDARDAGARLDAWIARNFDCSRARARELMEAGHVRVDDHPVDASAKGRRLLAGQAVAVAVDPSALDRIEPAPRLPVEILAEGDGWIVVDKPAGVPVHPLRADETDTLLQRLAARRPSIVGIGEGGLRSGVVHRLDVDTSGCQAFATEPRSFETLRAAFREHRVDKVYRAIVGGRPPDDGVVDLDLVVGRHLPARVGAFAAGEGPGGSRRCRNQWRRLEQLDGRHALVEARPHTGFLHQIRVTLAHLGHPLVGDAAYGDGTGASRHMLHASALRVGPIDAASPDPEDFRACLQRYRGD